ncbi:unnamed protein product [Umbelopsis vinacea]|jgi:hypothetical protein
MELGLGGRQSSAYQNVNAVNASSTTSVTNVETDSNGKGGSEAIVNVPDMPTGGDQLYMAKLHSNQTQVVRTQPPRAAKTKQRQLMNNLLSNQDSTSEEARARHSRNMNNNFTREDCSQYTWATQILTPNIYLEQLSFPILSTIKQHTPYLSKVKKSAYSVFKKYTQI